MNEQIVPDYETKIRPRTDFSRIDCSGKGCLTILAGTIPLQTSISDRGFLNTRLGIIRSNIGYHDSDLSVQGKMTCLLEIGDDLNFFNQYSKRIGGI